MRQPIELIVDFEIRYLFNSDNRIDKPCKNTKTEQSAYMTAPAALQPVSKNAASSAYDLTGAPTPSPDRAHWGLCAVR